MRQISKFRTVLIFIMFVFLYIAILINLYFIQILQTDFFNALASRQYHIELTNFPTRGQILDRFGRPVAINKESISAFILPRQLQDKKALKSFLKRYFPEAKKRMNRFLDKYFMYVARRLPDDLCEYEDCEKIVDLKFMKEPSRYYPNEAMGSIVGIVNIDNHGIFGIEQLYDKVLAGKPTKIALDKDARSTNFYFKQDLQKNGEQGDDIYLTIDSDLQFLVYEALAEAYAALEALYAPENCVLAKSKLRTSVMV